MLSKFVVGGDVVAPAVGEGLAGIGAEVEDGDDFGIGHGVEGGGEVVVGRFSVEHAMAAGDGNARRLGHSGISCAGTAVVSGQWLVVSGLPEAGKA